MSSAIGWYPFRGTTYVDIPANATTDACFTLSICEIATAVGEEMMGASLTDGELHRLMVRIHSLRVTAVTTTDPLSVRFLIPSRIIEATTSLTTDTLRASFAEKECYPTPIRYPSVAYTYPKIDSRLASIGGGSWWFKIGQADYIIAVVTVQKPSAKTRILITYDTRYRWCESAFHPTEAPAPSSFARLKGWSTKLKALNTEAHKVHEQQHGKNPATTFTPPYRIPRSVDQAIGSISNLSIGE